MKTLLTVALSLWLALPAMAYYRMTPQDMTDEQLVREYHDLEYEQGKRERVAQAYSRGGIILRNLTEKKVKEIHDQKIAVQQEMKRRHLEP